VGPLLPFEELVNEEGTDNSFPLEEECSNNRDERCVLPDPRTLLHVTSRKKAPVRKKSSLVVCSISFFLFIFLFIIVLLVSLFQFCYLVIVSLVGDQ